MPAGARPARARASSAPPRAPRILQGGVLLLLAAAVVRGPIAAVYGLYHHKIGVALLDSVGRIRVSRHKRLESIQLSVIQTCCGRLFDSAFQ